MCVFLQLSRRSARFRPGARLSLIGPPKGGPNCCIILMLDLLY